MLAWCRALVVALAAVGFGLAAGAGARAQAPAIAFEKDELVVRTATGDITFKVELAVTQAQKNRGLMFRESLEPYTGMLFDFGTPQIVNMWMMNTLIPLDMIFIDTRGKIISIAANTRPMSTETISSGGQAKGVLEIGGGTARLLGIRPGDRVIHRFFDGTTN